VISYWVMTGTLISIINKDSDLLGGMWAGVNTGSVFRMTHEDSWQAGMAQLIATNVSFALCLLCLSFFPFTGVGMAALIGIGTLVMILLDRRDDIVTTGTTTAAAMWCSHQSAGCLASTAAAPWLTPWSELGLASHAKGGFASLFPVRRETRAMIILDALLASIPAPAVTAPAGFFRKIAYENCRL